MRTEKNRRLSNPRFTLFHLFKIHHLSVFLVGLFRLSFVTDAEAFELTVAPTLIDFNYKEFSTTGEILNREDGLLSGIDLSASTPLGSHGAASLHLGLADGLVDYVGQTQLGTPHETKTNERLFKLGLGLQRTVFLKSCTMTFSANLSRHRWERDIKTVNGVSGLFEVYQWWEAATGVQISLGRFLKGQLSADLEIFKTLDPTIEVDFSDVGLQKLDLGEEIGRRVRLGWQRQGKNGWIWGITASYTVWGFGRSAVKLIPGGNGLGIVEPESESRQTRLQLFFSKQF